MPRRQKPQTPSRSEISRPRCASLLDFQLQPPQNAEGITTVRSTPRCLKPPRALTNRATSSSAWWISSPLSSPGRYSLFRRRRGSGISRTPPLIPPYKRCGPMEGRLAQDLPEAQPSILPKSYKVCPSLTNLSRLGLPLAVTQDPGSGKIL